MRFLYLLGLVYILLCGWVLAGHYAPYRKLQSLNPGPGQKQAGSQWFIEAKPYCNPLEVEMRLAAYPPPEDATGQGYGAACLALAGQLDRARSVLKSLSEQDRTKAAEIVYGIAQPVADSGDDKSSAPIMELVLEFSPGHTMALYYAGMSEYMLGQYEPAGKHLRRFIELYPTSDSARSNALEVISRLQ